MDVPLGSGTVSFDLPECEAAVCEPPGQEPVDVDAAAERAIADPHGPPLAELVDPDDVVEPGSRVLVVPDALDTPLV